MEDPHTSGQAAAGAPDPDPPWRGTGRPDGNPDPGPPGPLNPPPGVQPPYEDKKRNSKRNDSDHYDLDKGEIHETAAKTANNGRLHSNHRSTAPPNQECKSRTDRWHEYMPSPGQEEDIKYSSRRRNFDSRKPRQVSRSIKYKLPDHQERKLGDFISAVERQLSCADPSRQDAIPKPFDTPQVSRGSKYILPDHQNREIDDYSSAVERQRSCPDPSRMVAFPKSSDPRLHNTQNLLNEPRMVNRKSQHYRPEPGRKSSFVGRASPSPRPRPPPPPPPHLDPPRNPPPQHCFTIEPAYTNGSSRSWNAINVQQNSHASNNQHRSASSRISSQYDVPHRAILSPTPEASRCSHQNGSKSLHFSKQNAGFAHTPISVSSDRFNSDATTSESNSSNPLHTLSLEEPAPNSVGGTEDGRVGKRMDRSDRLNKNRQPQESKPPSNRRMPIQTGLRSSTNRAYVSIGSLLIDNQHRVENRGDGQVTRMGAGESYRPTARPRSPRSPPRADTFRTNRDGSPRRERARTPISDSYHPRNPSPRRRSRSRSPSYRRDRSRDNSYRGRPRSPPRARSPPRRFSPRRDDDRRERPRSPRRDERRRSRSPYDRDRFAPRARSPLPRRSPPTGPRGSYRRSRSPDRRDDRAPTGPSSASWRRRSPSPAARDSERSSGRTSGDTSRRSSPHVHPSRLHLTQAATRETSTRSPPTRDRSPHSQSAYRDRDSARSTPRERSPVRPVARSPPRGPAAFRTAPTGPSSSRNFIAPSPVQQSIASVSMSAHNRPENAGPVVPPAGPRGYNPSARGSSYMRGGRGSFSADRQARPDTTAWGSAPPSRPAAETKTVSRPTPSPSPSVPSGPSSAPIPTGPSSSIPTGPRAGTGIPSRPSLQHSSSVYGPRPTQPSTASGPRPHPAMANLAQIIPGGRIDPTASGIPADVAGRLNRKEEEAEVLRQDLEAKRDKLRQNLKIWDKLSRESASVALKTELSERHVRMLAGEGVGGAAF